MRRLRIGAVVVILLVLGWAAGVRWGLFQRAPDTIGLKDRVSGVRLPVIGEDGRMVSLSDLRGKGVLLNFWAPWCEPCRKELPMLERLQERYGGLHFNIVGVTDDRIERVKKYLKLYPLSYPTLEDKDGRLRSRFGADVLPYTVYVGPDGRVAGGHRGLLDEPSAVEAIERLIILSRQHQREPAHE